MTHKDVRVDGPVVIPNSEPAALLRPILRARIPVVLLEHDLPGVPWLEGRRVGPQHLLGLGHRCVALLLPKAETGRLAGEMILKPLRGEEWPARTVTLPTEPVVRELAAPSGSEGPRTERTRPAPRS